VVQGVQGISWTELTIRGRSAHAGTTPIRLRRDAGLAAARVASGVGAIVREMGGDQVGTVGSLSLAPNLVNVVAEKAVVTVDLRNPDDSLLKDAEDRLAALIDQVAREEGVSVERRSLARFEPVDFSPALIEQVGSAARALGFSERRLYSGAGHDAQMLARIAPSAMIFTPSVNGVSHNVTEFTEPADLIKGANVLLQVALQHALPSNREIAQ